VIVSQQVPHSEGLQPVPGGDKERASGPVVPPGGGIGADTGMESV